METAIEVDSYPVVEAAQSLDDLHTGIHRLHPYSFMSLFCCDCELSAGTYMDVAQWWRSELEG